MAAARGGAPGMGMKRAGKSAMDETVESDRKEGVG
jgi:hypothetical protein